MILCLILLAVGFRVVHLKADPPANFSWSGGYFADEGFWSHNARNEVLFGKAVQDEWDARIVSPIFAFLQGIVFRALGVGLAQVRLIGILSSVIIAVASFLFFRKQYDAGASFRCSILVGLNYPMLVLGRQGILDPFAAALGLAALSLLFTESGPALFLAGVLLVSSCVTKYLMVYLFLPLAFAAFTVFRLTRRKWLYFLSGILLAALFWVFADYLPHRDLLLDYNRYYSSQQSWELVNIAKNLVLQPFYLYFVKTPAILFFGNLMLWYFLIRPASTGKVERVCWVWLVSGILFFALWRYRPLRYYTSLILPLAGLAGMSLGRIEDVADELRTGRRRLWLWIGMLVPAIQLAFVLEDRWLGWHIVPKQLGIQTWDAIAFLIVSTTIVFILMYTKTHVKWAAVVFVLAFLACDVRSYLAWMLRPEYAAIEIAGDLQKRVGEGVLSGQWAPELCLENRVRVVPVWHDFVNSADPFRKYGITHLLVWQYALGGEKFNQWYPEEFARFHPVARYRIKDSDLILLEGQ